MYDGLGNLLGSFFFYVLLNTLIVFAGVGAFVFLRRRRDQGRHTTSPSQDGDIHIGSLCSGGTSRVTMNGMTLVMKGGKFTVNGQPWGPIREDGTVAPLPEPPKVVLNQDGTITGPVLGDLIIEGPGPVTLIVKGDVGGSVEVAKGNVQCGNVQMSVDAGGNVTCGDVNLSVDAKGNVTCGDVNLSVKAGGNVYRK